MATPCDSASIEPATFDVNQPVPQSPEQCDSSSNGSNGKRLKRWISLGEAPQVSEVLMVGHKVVPTSTVMVDGVPTKVVLVKAAHDNRSWLSTSFGWSSLPSTFQPLLVREIVDALTRARGKRTMTLWKGNSELSDVIVVNVRGRDISVLNRTPKGCLSAAAFLIADVGAIAWFAAEWYSDIKTALSNTNMDISASSCSAASASSVSDSIPAPFDTFDADDIGDAVDNGVDKMIDVDEAEHSANDDAVERHQVQSAISEIKQSDATVYWLSSKHSFKNKRTKHVVRVPRTHMITGNFDEYLADLRRLKADAVAMPSAPDQL